MKQAKYSFLIYGAKLRGDNTKFLIEAAGRLGFDTSIYAEDFYPYEILSEIAAELKLEDYYGNEHKYCYIGKTPFGVKDVENTHQFKTKVEEMVAKYFGDDIECNYYGETF